MKKQTAYKFLVSPDYLPKHFLEWYRFNTRLQQDINHPIHLMMPSGQEAYRNLLASEEPDIVYANPFDAGDLIHQHHYLPLAKPSQYSNEVIIFSKKDGDYAKFEDLKPGCTIAAMPNKDIEMMGLRLLEAVDLSKADLNWAVQDYAQVVARMVRDGQADAGLMLAEMYHHLEASTQAQFNILIESALNVMRHIFLIKGHHRTLFHALQQALIHCADKESYKSILSGLNTSAGYTAISTEETLFMMDILETLRD